MVSDLVQVHGLVVWYILSLLLSVPEEGKGFKSNNKMMCFLFLNDMFTHVFLSWRNILILIGAFKDSLVTVVILPVWKYVMEWISFLIPSKFDQLKLVKPHINFS